MVTNGASCPTGYSAEFNFKWPGTVAGCNCKKATTTGLRTYNLTAKIYTQSCSTNMTLAGCPDIASTPAVDMNMIPKVEALTKVANNGDTVCVKREKGVSFVSTAKNMKEDGTCLKGSLCGGDGQTGGSYSMCLETTCPVTNVKIENSNSNSSFTDAGATHLGTNLYIARTGGNLPLAELTASVSHVCKNDNNAGYFGGKSTHPLLASSDNIQFTCEGGSDNTFVKIVIFFFYLIF